MLKGFAVQDQQLTPRAYEYAHPQLSPALRETIARLEPVARERWPFEPEALLRKACDKTGLSDFGDAGFREALQVLCESAEDELDLNAIGRRNLHGQILDHLMQRLRFEDLWKRHPEILQLNIDRPLFIVGLPRSGTTFLQHLLARDPAMRVVPFWEQLSPLPEHDAARRPPDDAPLIEQARKNVEGLRQNAPGLLQMHQLAAEDPDEEIYLLAPGFSSMIYEWVYILPRYAEWYARQDHTGGYRYFKRVLQTLQWLRGGERWLLKAPQHMEQLKPLLAVFPDATIIETLRDPATAAVSTANLTTYGQRLRTDHPDPLATGAAIVGLIQRLVLALLRDRPDGDARFVQVHFQALMSDPLGAARRIYAAAGLELGAEVVARMHGYVEENRGGKHVKSEYSAADFGIDVPALRRSLQQYYQRFGVPEDAKL